MEPPPNSGLSKLKEIVENISTTPGLTRTENPIVLVPGFTGFGEPIFGSINYWGGFEDLAAALQTHTGVPVILPRIGPISSNWERACELYCQLREIQRTGTDNGFDTRSTPTPSSIAVDYGRYIDLPPDTARTTKRAVVLGQLEPEWTWTEAHPVHMICHSQGGNTVRLLIELLSGRHAAQHPRYFPSGSNQQALVKSVVTLGTPYRGTTITSVIFDQILRDVHVNEVITRLVVSSALHPTRFLDLQLEHWGFAPQAAGESFIAMHNRLEAPILAWWNSDNNGIKDNGPDGIARLNRDFNPQPSPQTYYFTLSFDATRPFPTLNFSPANLQSFPVHGALSLWGFGFPGLLGDISASVGSFLSSAAHSVLNAIPGNPSDAEYARWLVEVANNQARALGYQFRLPRPGGRIPRPDMLPLLSLFSLGMSGVCDSRLSGPSEQNDGFIDTVSMRGPDEGGGPVRDDIGSFSTAALGENKGVYWHLGVTEGIDHADEVGVFTVKETVRMPHK
ncbi:hypothetical protein BJY01DRAFT_261389 [Aspergillus pseudoustus]|uniref:Lipase-like C-terminal domain-containing protein n=1 Tax=Aspergillus pseudoustus TaxID=1810923 RepID=A0ABR4IMT1_9EURO